jgi:hypothetical protein
MDTLTAALWAINLEPPATTLAAGWRGGADGRRAGRRGSAARPAGIRLRSVAQLCAPGSACESANLLARLANWRGAGRLATLACPLRGGPATRHYAFCGARPPGGSAPALQPRLAAAAGRARIRPGQAVPHSQRTRPCRMAPHPRDTVNVLSWEGLRVAIVVWE